MFKSLFETKPTSKLDVGLALVGFVFAGLKAYSTIVDYKTESTKENEK